MGKKVTWFTMLGSLNISYLLPIVGTKRPRGIVFIDCILGPTNSKEYYAPRVVECMIISEMLNGFLLTNGNGRQLTNVSKSAARTRCIHCPRPTASVTHLRSTSQFMLV